MRMEVVFVVAVVGDGVQGLVAVGVVRMMTVAVARARGSSFRVLFGRGRRARLRGSYGMCRSRGWWGSGRRGMRGEAACCWSV